MLSSHAAPHGLTCATSAVPGFNLVLALELHSRLLSVKFHEHLSSDTVYSVLQTTIAPLER